MRRGNRTDSIGTCSICGYHGPGPAHDCKLTAAEERAEQELTLDRNHLNLGKYTKRYAELTPDQLTGLLWLLGEWSCRVRPDGSLGCNKNRAKVALETLQKFHKEPLGREEVRALMREAARGKA